MVGEDVNVLLTLSLNPKKASLDGLKGDGGAVALIGLATLKNGNQLFFNGQGLFIQPLGKASPGDTFPNNCSAAPAIYRFEVFIHKANHSKILTVPTVPCSPLKRGNTGTVWSGVSLLFRGMARNSCGTPEQLDIRTPRLYIVGKEFALMAVKILLTLFPVGDKGTGNKGI